MTTSFANDSQHLAEAYDRVSNFQFEEGKRLVERLELVEGARVLDVGCGTGRLTRWIAEQLGPKGSVVGIDPLEHRISFARSKAGSVRFEVGQAEDLSAFEDESFDAVCMSAVLHWVSDKAKALAETRRVLRPGGRVAVTTLPQELSHAGTIALVLKSLLQSPPYAEHVERSAGKRGCTSSELVSLVLESRLELVELQITQTVSHHQSGEAFVEFAEASSFGNLLSMVPEVLRASLRADLVSAFESRRSPEGIVVRGWGVLFVAQRP
jgi:ubiquinone/menaquinone biosynthesis C-methylase UbiE